MARNREAEIERAVLASIEDITGVPIDRIRLNDALLRDLKMDGDDFTFVFVPGLEKVLGIKTDPSVWSQVYTVQQAIHVFLSASTV
jgi:hypothetical protein